MIGLQHSIDTCLNVEDTTVTSRYLARIQRMSNKRVHPDQSKGQKKRTTIRMSGK